MLLQRLNPFRRRTRVHRTCDGPAEVADAITFTDRRCSISCRFLQRPTQVAQIIDLIRARRERVDDPATPERVAVDFSEVVTVDSVTLSGLMRLKRELRGVQVEVELCGVCDGVRDVFHVTRLERVFDTDPVAVS